MDEESNSRVSYTSLLKCLLQTCKQRLTAKQKIILRELLDNNRNATQLVDYLSQKLYCSKSALWNNIRELKESGLVCWNGKCELTEIGMIVSKEIRGEEND